jgi:transcription initiation factor IIF auxiliary subunit
MIEFEKVKFSRVESDSFRIKQSSKYIDDGYWDWSVWIESKEPEKLDKIVSVTYHLHHTFPDPVRVVKDRDSKFRLDTSGWGEFIIYIVIKLKGEYVIELEHYLKLSEPKQKAATKSGAKKTSKKK